MIDIYSTLHETYENAGTSIPLEDWLVENGWYRRSEEGGLDVHPNAEGYRTFYSAAVVRTLKKDWDELIRQPAHAPIYCKKEASFLNGTYSYVMCTDPRLSYSDGWKTHKSRLALWLNLQTDEIPQFYLEYPHFENGIVQVENHPGASFSYETDADELDMALISSTEGLSATVLCDETEVGELRCGSKYNNMEFPAGAVTLPDDDGTHKITVRIDDPTDEAYLFRFGYLIEFRRGEEQTDTE